MESDEEAGCFTLTWEIVNFSLFLSAEEGFLRSPVWKVEDTEGCELWRLLVYHSCSSINFGPFRFIVDWQLDAIQYEMSIISSSGEVALKRNYLSPFSIAENAIHGEKRQSIFPNDTLTLCFRKRGKIIRTRESRIYSVLHNVDKMWHIERLYLSCSYNTLIEKDNLLLYVSLKTKTVKGTHTVVVGEVPSVEDCLSFVDCKLSIEGGRGSNISKTCAFPYSRFEFDIDNFLENNTSVNLQLQSIIALHKGYRDQLALHVKPKIVRHKNVSEAVSGSSGALSDDLLLLYKERTLSDVTLNTEGESFSAHRSILVARSPVFHAMFEKNEMKEGRSGVVDIEDVDSTTVDRMLVFLYSDSFENLQWEEASALYYAADKYAILTLKQKCADILKAGLSVSNACDALVLADKHLDQELMKCTVEFIHDHDEIVSSSDWDELESNNLLLASKTMRQLYLKKGKK